MPPAETAPAPCTGFSKATMKVVMLATLCSKPVEKKAKRHQKIMISLAESLLVWKPDQTARQTKMLQRMPRKKSWPAGAAILAAAALVKTVAVTGRSRPDLTNIQAKMPAPSKLPSQQTSQRRPAWPSLTFFWFSIKTCVND
jgi:hypothetical protein